MDHFRGDEMVSLLRSSFNEIHAQSHILADRSKIFSYHHFLLNNKLSEITPLGMDYLLGYIQVRIYGDSTTTSNLTYFLYILKNKAGFGPFPRLKKIDWANTF
jgi:hypothetical protein